MTLASGDPLHKHELQHRKSRDYDVLVLGASPLRTIHALHFHHPGRRAALLERARAHRFVREKLGLELTPAARQDILDSKRCNCNATEMPD